LKFIPGRYTPCTRLLSLELRGYHTVMYYSFDVNKPVLWIRNRIDSAVLDPEPDPYAECGSRSRSMEITQINK
jgi:hypothetical protein